MIRLKLEDFDNIKHLKFDLEDRRLVVFHSGQLNDIQSAIASLSLGDQLVESVETEENSEQSKTNQRRALRMVLLINIVFFLLEMLFGFISKSMGLIADSLDMLADAFVYGMSLMVVGASKLAKQNVARLAGILQMILALLGFAEVVRRFFENTVPDHRLIMTVAALALVANALCLIILKKTSGKGDAHMKASMIFTSNDIIINLGVILAGGLVYFLNSNKPDLIIGGLVFIIVLRGAFRILKLARN